MECEETATGSNLSRRTLISDIEIGDSVLSSRSDERNRPRNMSASEFTHWLLELRWLTHNQHIINNYNQLEKVNDNDDSSSKHSKNEEAVRSQQESIVQRKNSKYFTHSAIVLKITY